MHKGKPGNTARRAVGPGPRRIPAGANIRIPRKIPHQQASPGTRRCLPSLCSLKCTGCKYSACIQLSLYVLIFSRLHTRSVCAVRCAPRRPHQKSNPERPTWEVNKGNWSQCLEPSAKSLWQVMLARNPSHAAKTIYNRDIFSRGAPRRFPSLEMESYSRQTSILCLIPRNCRHSHYCFPAIVFPQIVPSLCSLSVMLSPLFFVLQSVFISEIPIQWLVPDLSN